MTAVYIPTRARFGNLMKVVPRWMDALQKVPVILVVDKSEVSDVKGLMAREGWPSDKVWIQPVKDNKGIGYVRRQAVLSAERQGFKSIIMSDDDARPVVGASMNLLLRFAAKPTVLGIGANHSYLDLLSGGITARESGPILCPSGWGFRMFALNIKNTVAVGNFDPALTCWGEDAEVMRNGLKAGFPWLVHCGAKSEAIGKRYADGGLAAYTESREARTEQERVCQQIIHDRWPDFTSAPPKPSRVAWQKMYDHYLPNWRERSAIHGGSL